MTSPLSLVIAIKAVQFTMMVVVEPRLRSPKSTGKVQFKGSETGDPRQIKLALLSVFRQRSISI